MSRAVIRLGDDTSYRGRVITASARLTIDGIPVALWGDRCSCPHEGHDNCVICEGEPQAMFDGISVALEGHKTSCGATLLASQLNRCNVSPLVQRSAPVSSSLGAAASATTAVSTGEQAFDEQIQLIDPNTGQPLAGVDYKIVTDSRKTFTGKTGPDGKTVRVKTDGADQLQVYLVG